MSLKIGREKLERAFNGRAGHGDEITKTFAFVKSEDLSKLHEDRLAALALLNFLQQRCQGVRFHSASRALAAGFRSKELRNFQDLLDDATPLGNETNDAATQR